MSSSPWLHSSLRETRRGSQSRSIAPHGQALVTKHNKLIQARYVLSLQEKRLILWLVSAICPGDTDFHSYRVSVRTLAELLASRRIKTSTPRWRRSPAG